FDDPYVPASVGSSRLSGRIITDPITDVTNAEIILRGEYSTSVIADANGKFQIKDITPGSYILQIQKSPYLQSNITVDIPKAVHKDLGDIHLKLNGAISGKVPLEKISTLYGEFEIVVYVDGVPRLPVKNKDGEYSIDHLPTSGDVKIYTVTKTIVFIDNEQYSAKVLEDGEILTEFVPPGVYNSVKVKTTTKEGFLPLTTEGPIVVNSGETRYLSMGN
ncbi:MAG: hypothetical protein ACPL7B_13550, partial [Candidatus Poribacteria bacterium]